MSYRWLDRIIDDWATEHIFWATILAVVAAMIVSALIVIPLMPYLGKLDQEYVNGRANPAWDLLFEFVKLKTECGK